MRKQDEYLATSHWYREVITDPYQIIAEFFSADDIASYREHIETLLLAAHSNDIWNKSSPGDLLYYLKLLESVINAAFLINKHKKHSPLNISERDIFNPNLYFGGHGGATEWGCFPRALSLEEYQDPYLAFRAFFKFMTLDQWKEELTEISECALVNMSLTEGGVEIDTLPLYIHLTKLVEAAHLIDVREINHIGGHIKSRIKPDNHWIRH